MNSIASKQFFRRNKQQRGDFLIESLIGMVLMAIIGMGVVMVTSKMSVAQKDMRMQEIAINQLRAYLMNNGTGAINICSSAPTVNLPGMAAIPTTVYGCSATTTAVVNGVPVANVPRPLYISVSDAALGGEVIVGPST